MPIIHLTDDQKQKLADLADHAPELIIHRARLILGYAAGKPTLQAAREAGISRGRARFWKRQFLARGMDIFILTPPAAKTGEQALPGAETEAGRSDGQQREEGEAAESASRLEIAYPQPRESIGIILEDTLADAGRKVWLFHFALMLSYEEGTLQGEDAEQLHDMRVATRRMRTAFDVFGRAFEQKSMKRYLKGLRGVGRVLGEVRDMDVILEQAHSYQKQVSEAKRDGLEPLLSAWKQIIAKKRSKMTKHLLSEDYQMFKHDFNLFLQSPQGAKETLEYSVMNSQLRDIVPVLVYGRYASVRGYETILPHASVIQLHALRIEFKKFRYVLEYFREILGENASQAISEIKHYQDHLGELHDTDVACQLVSDFLSDWEEEQFNRPIFARDNPEPVVTYLAYLHAERYHLMSSFPEQWKKFSRPEFRQNIAQAISSL